MTALTNVVWLGGAQWAGKTTVARLLAARYPIVTYHYDYHDARSHALRARQDPTRFPTFSCFLAGLDEDPSEFWVNKSPEEMADESRGIVNERFAMVLEDLANMPEGLVVLAEGWGLRPNLLSAVVDDSKRMVFMVPTDSFRAHQEKQLERARTLSFSGLSDSDRAQRNRVARDVILAHEVVQDARHRGMRVIEVDGSRDEAAIAALVEDQFRPYLPVWLY